MKKQEISLANLARLILGFLLLAAGLWLFYKEYKRDTIRPGVISKVNTYRKGAVYTVSFFTPSTAPMDIRFRGEKNMFRTGDRLEVVYDPDQPGDARVNLGSEMSDVAFGSIFLMIAISLFVVSYQEHNSGS